MLAGLKRSIPLAPQERKARKAALWHYARSFQQQLHRELKPLVAKLSAAELAAPGWVEGEVLEKMRDLMNTYPALSGLRVEVREQMRGHLLKGHAYKASVVAAANVCCISQRSLERNRPSLP